MYQETAAINCPVDFVTTDENRARLVAFFVVLFTILFVIYHNLTVPALLTADFTTRVLNLNTYSPLALFSGLLLKQAVLKLKHVDRAPKRFAAIVGLFFFRRDTHVIVAGLGPLRINCRRVAYLICFVGELRRFLREL